ncbi:MAG: peptidylprolyl isomerase [Alphaproteobacteria bacterium]|nr:peptidylprolyl isomerase [Alphaproteobacteria bacterium]
MITAPGILINGVKITPEQIDGEVQYHPAGSLPEARYEAMQALVVRELLIQRAAELGLCKRDEAIETPDAIIDDLLVQELSVPEADEDTCKRYYDNNRQKFFTSPLFEVSHILYLAPPEDNEARKEAKSKADKALTELQESPDLFESLAREESGCSSAKDNGRLGQISKGQTMPEFEAALLRMCEGELSTEPVETEVGYHIIKVHKHLEGKELPFETVQDRISDYLSCHSWQRAFSQYIQLLAGRAEISGFNLKLADSVLVQ